MKLNKIEKQFNKGIEDIIINNPLRSSELKDSIPFLGMLIGLKHTDHRLKDKKEFVNHKILDFLGDLYLSGHKIIGKVICSQGGHKLTNQLMREVFSDKSNFSIFEIKEKNIVKEGEHGTKG